MVVKIFRKKKEPKKIFEGSLEDVKRKVEDLAFSAVEKLDEVSKYITSIKGISLKDSKISIKTTEKEDIEVELYLDILLKRK
jgi:hypothetical protein